VEQPLHEKPRGRLLIGAWAIRKPLQIGFGSIFSSSLSAHPLAGRALEPLGTGAGPKRAKSLNPQGRPLPSRSTLLAILLPRLFFAPPSFPLLWIVSQEAHFLFPAPPSIVRSHFIIRQPPLQPFLSIQEPRGNPSSAATLPSTISDIPRRSHRLSPPQPCRPACRACLIATDTWGSL
jgi:hypothetical protein